VSRRKEKGFTRAELAQAAVENGLIGDPVGHVVMHHCDNPLCVNPAHLEAATQYENCQDQVRKDRQNLGGRHCPRCLKWFDPA
jgi:hypothetical protein